MNRFLTTGEPVPWFHAQALNGRARYAFDTAAGRWTVLLLMESGAHEQGQAALRLLANNRSLFDDDNACFFGVTTDPSDVAQKRISVQIPGVRWFLDYDGAVSRLYGASRGKAEAVTHMPHWLLLDPMQRVHSIAKLEHGDAIMRELRTLLGQPPAISSAPVLVVPHILSRDLCRQLIAEYEHHGGEESGFMREENGITVTRTDHSHKRRSDHLLENGELVAQLKAGVELLLKPLIWRAFQFEVTRIERFIVACYDAAEGGHFRQHRDNTTKGTAHRKFACTINLNAEDYEGGDLCFPEFGSRSYRAPTGGAVVFSCSLLHQAQVVTKGRRYAFLPFLYDDDGARIRERNLEHVEERLQNYRPAPSPASPAENLER
ncbi:MAG: 2OG-Fe(II) oxygenase [Sphingomonadales bacterium]|nr:2OG-Fe(II) oxygenase [Sphingomonadales bacterium]